MAILVRDKNDPPERDYPLLFMRLCSCGGTQPSRTDPKVDGHERWCPYRVEVERDGNTGE